MLPELTNLLPEVNVRAFRRSYFTHLFIVATIMLLVLMGIHSVLLMPTHLLLSSHIETREEQLEFLATSGISEEEATLQERLATLAETAERIGALRTAPSAVSTVADVLAVDRTRVTLSGLSYGARGGEGPSVTLTGVANTREDLRRYQLAFQSMPFVAVADLPVSTYAKEAQIPFTITLVLVSP
ncbi:hypothetical protein A3H77_00770 [Candidatus Kaiserbacteria bacterium RIFCSPLOWO2_02_FULL_56_11]|nr:MAG: hypothetical protein A3H77_00770 [Candidatus Kaiserbacteria bacterium RIFCSPLOWO2_02_FULL_56_11]